MQYKELKGNGPQNLKKLFSFVNRKITALLVRMQDSEHRLAASGLPLTRASRTLFRLRNKHKGKRCFILGNGPSLKEQDIGLLNDEFVFVTNYFFLHKDFSNLKHCFYFAGDPIFCNYAGEINPEFLESIVSSPRVTVFLNRACQPLFRKKKINLQNPVFFLKINNERKVWEGRFSTDILFENCWGWTTIIDMCLPVAFYLGFDRVYLMGCDCDYRFEKAENFSQSYFYDIARLPQAVLQRMRESKASGGYGHSSEIMASYNVVKKYFEDSGRRIYNAGYGGKLEVFERVNYDEVIADVSNNI